MFKKELILKYIIRGDIQLNMKKEYIIFIAF